MSVSSKANVNRAKSRTSQTSNWLVFVGLLGVMILGYFILAPAVPVTIDERILTIEDLGTGYFVVEYPGTFQEVQTALPGVIFSEESDWNEFQEQVTVERNELGFTTIYSHRSEGVLWVQRYDFQILYHQASV